MRFPRVVLLGLAIMLASCAANNTIGRLKKVDPDVKYEAITGGLDQVITGGFDGMMQSYQRILDRMHDSAMIPDAMQRLADLKMQQEDKVSKIDGSDLDLLEAGTTGAVTLYLKLLEKYPDYEPRDQVLYQLSRAYDEQGNIKESVKIIHQLLNQYPHSRYSDELQFRLGEYYFTSKKYPESIKAYQAIVAAGSASAYYELAPHKLGWAYYKQDLHDDSLQQFIAVLDHKISSGYNFEHILPIWWIAENAGATPDLPILAVVACLDRSDLTLIIPLHARQRIALPPRQPFSLTVNRVGRVRTMPAQLAVKNVVGTLYLPLLAAVSCTDEGDLIPTRTVEDRRAEDIFRVVSLIFSNREGGASAVSDHFDKIGPRAYEANVFSDLGEYYFEKKRYTDAAASYKLFVKRNPYHKQAPLLDMRVIEIYKGAGFPKLVIEANKEYVKAYGLESEFWKHSKINDSPDVVNNVKVILKELAFHYHALYQDSYWEMNKAKNLQEAIKWYREFLASFPQDKEALAINLQFAELLLESKDYAAAVVEYERIAYDYPAHEKAAAAGYFAVYAYRKAQESQTGVAEDERDRVRRDITSRSMKFADTFPQHEKAALVLGAVVDDIFVRKEYELAASTARRLLASFPEAEQPIRRAAWLVIAHSAFELGHYGEAEEGYLNGLQLSAKNESSSANLTELLADSIYKQGELASKQADYTEAARHFLRVGQLAPSSQFRPVADYDGATALMQIKDWDKAAEVLRSFRVSYPKHKLQPEVSKKLASAYKEAGKGALAAVEYERIETESKDVEVRREALLLAAELYTSAQESDKAFNVYQRYLKYFPQPIEPALEMRNKIATLLKARNDMAGYLSQLKQIVEADAKAGAARTERTNYLAATSALVLTEPLFGQFAEIKLVQPFKKNLERKSKAMKAAKAGFEKLLSYEVGDVTATATYYLAEMNYSFSRALIESERPGDMDDEEKEQYELLIEEQAYPFEERAIKIHEENLELLTLGIYNTGVMNSMEKLAVLMPARYAKPEESSGFIQAIDAVDYSVWAEPQVAPLQEAPSEATPLQEAPSEAVPLQPEAIPAQEGIVDIPTIGLENK